MFTNIVWATDGSEQADRALGYAAEIASRDGAALHVVHVIEKVIGGRMAGQFNAYLNEEQLDDKIRRQTRELADEGTVTATLHLTAGRSADIARRITEVATETGADLIVIGTRGHAAVVGALVGSVTQHLLHIAPCPVLAVPPARTAVGSPSPESAAAAS